MVAERFLSSAAQSSAFRRWNSRRLPVYTALALTMAYFLVALPLQHPTYAHALSPFSRPHPTDALLALSIPLSQGQNDTTVNPLIPPERIAHGPWTASIPSRVRTDKTFKMQFRCDWSADVSMCPESYIVWFKGPTSSVVMREEQFIRQIDNRTVEMEWTLRDPGEYMVYALPEFITCQKFNHLRTPLSKTYVQGSPFRLQVTGPPPHESYEPCTQHNSTDGRWISTAHVQPEHRSEDWLTSSLVREDAPEYVYQPYECKRPRPNMRAAISSPEYEHVENVLFIGDSTMRMSYCTMFYGELHGWETAEEPPACLNRNTDWTRWHTLQYTTERLYREFEHMTDTGRMTSWGYIWMGDARRWAEGHVKIAELAKGPRKITQVVVNLGLWVMAFDEPYYVKWVEDILILIHNSFPEAHIIWRTTSTIAKTAHCDDRFSRLRSRMQVHASIGVVDRLRTEKSMNIDVLETHGLTDGRFAAAFDAVHWIKEDWNFPTAPAPVERREGEWAVEEWIWDIWRIEGQRRRQA